MTGPPAMPRRRAAQPPTADGVVRSPCRPDRRAAQTQAVPARPSVLEARSDRRPGGFRLRRSRAQSFRPKARRPYNSPRCPAPRWFAAASTRRAGTTTGRPIPPGTTTRPTREARRGAALSRRAARRRRACSTPAAAKASSSTNTPAGSTSPASTPTTRRRACTHGSVTALPFPDASFDRALCLDVLEHLAFEDQPRALAELFRVLRPGGELLVSVPNLAHLQSRIQFLLRGRLIRTASEYKHPGDRPVGEYLQLGRRAGFTLVARQRHLPDRAGAHAPRAPPSARARAAPPRADARCSRCPGWCFLNLLTFRKA